MALAPELLSLLACPEDKGPLYYVEDLDVLFNPRLQRAYHVRDGIPVMLIDEAQRLEPSESERLFARVQSEGISPTFSDAAAEAPGGAGVPSRGSGPERRGPATDAAAEAPGGAGVPSRGSGPERRGPATDAAADIPSTESQES